MVRGYVSSAGDHWIILSGWKALISLISRNELQVGITMIDTYIVMMNLLGEVELGYMIGLFLSVGC